MKMGLRAFWSNQPMPIQQKITNPDMILNLPFGNVLTLKTGVTSVNNKTGDVLLNAVDVGADSVGAARHVFDELSPKVDALIDNKLDKIDYVQHFRGLFSSYSALSSALPTALDGDYAHIDSGTGFDRMCAIWDSDDTKWKIIETNITANTDEMPEGSHNLYFQSERVRQTNLTGLQAQTASDILATDTILLALAKLQAQLKTSYSPVWLAAEDILTELNPNIIYSVIVQGKPAKLEFLKANGMLYIRGGFTIKQEMSQVIFGALKNEYKLKYAIDPTVIEQFVTWQMGGSTSYGKMFVYTFNPVDKLIDAPNVRQELKSAVGMLARSYHVFGCLGALLD